MLDDPRGTILPYDAVVLIAAEHANDALLRGALAPLVGAIPVELMREANYRFDRESDAEPAVAAARWLALRVLEH